MDGTGLYAVRFTFEEFFVEQLDIARLDAAVGRDLDEAEARNGALEQIFKTTLLPARQTSPVPPEIIGTSFVEEGRLLVELFYPDASGSQQEATLIFATSDNVYFVTYTMSGLGVGPEESPIKPALENGRVPSEEMASIVEEMYRACTFEP